MWWVGVGGRGWVWVGVGGWACVWVGLQKAGIVRKKLDISSPNWIYLPNTALAHKTELFPPANWIFAKKCFSRERGVLWTKVRSKEPPEMQHLAHSAHANPYSYFPCGLRASVDSEPQITWS